MQVSGALRRVSHGLVAGSLLYSSKPSQPNSSIAAGAATLRQLPGGGGRRPLHSSGLVCLAAKEVEVRPSEPVGLQFCLIACCN